MMSPLSTTDDNDNDNLRRRTSPSNNKMSNVDLCVTTTASHSNDSGSSNEQEDPKVSLSLVQRIPKYICSHDGKELAMVVLLTLICLAISFLTLQEPLERPIPFQYINETNTYILDQTLNQHSDGDSISDTLVALLTVVVCPLCQFLMTFVSPRRYRWIDAHRTACVYLLSLAVNDCLTFMLKSYMALPRPNFYQECQPNDTYDHCTLTDGLMGIPYHSGSFPSGHASYTFTSLTLLYLYLEARFGMTSSQWIVTTSNDDNEQQQAGLIQRTTKSKQYPLFLSRLASILFGLIPVLAVFMTASRIVDNQHHPADIIAGTLLGVTIAYFFHSLWFPDPRFANQNKIPAYAR